MEHGVVLPVSQQLAQLPDDRNVCAVLGSGQPQKRVIAVVCFGFVSHACFYSPNTESSSPTLSPSLRTGEGFCLPLTSQTPFPMGNLYVLVDGRTSKPRNHGGGAVVVMLCCRCSHRRRRRPLCRVETTGVRSQARPPLAAKRRPSWSSGHPCVVFVVAEEALVNSAKRKKAVDAVVCQGGEAKSSGMDQENRMSSAFFLA